MIAERRAVVQRSRLCSDRQMLSQMVGVIASQEVRNPLVSYVANPILSLYFLLLKTLVRW